MIGKIINFMPRKKGIIISTCILISFGLIFLFKPIVDNRTIQMIFFGINCILGSKFTLTQLSFLRHVFYTHHSYFQARYQQLVLV